ncbi:MAG: peptidoglycan-binding protein [Clostridia bacterium]
MKKTLLALLLALLIPLSHTAQALSFETGFMPSPKRTAKVLSFETESVFPLENGAQGEAVTRVEERLIELGFTYGRADNRYDARTTAAVKWLERHLNTLPGYDFAVDGRVSEALNRVLMGDAFPVSAPLGVGSENSDVTRLQRRLLLLGYLAQVTGAYGPQTAQAVCAFQRRNQLVASGQADAATLGALYAKAAKPAVAAPQQTLVYVSIADQAVSCYGWAQDGFTKLLKVFPCSTGLPESETITGIYQTQEHCGEWYYFGAFHVWAKYAIRIRGPYLFHSTLYSDQWDGSAQRASIRALGRKASHGCIRLAVADEKWLYEHTDPGFTVIIY